MPQIPVQTGHHLRPRALLRAEHCTGAIGAAEGIVNVAHDGDVRRPHRRVQTTGIDPIQPVQRAAHRHKGNSVPIQKADAQRRGAAAAAIIGGTAAQPQDHPFRSGMHCRPQKFSHAVGSGALSAQVPLHQRKAGSCRHLHHCGPIRQMAVKCGDRPSVGAGAGDLLPAAPQCGEKRIHASLSAVRHRDADNVSLRQVAPQCRSHDGADLL